MRTAGGRLERSAPYFPVSDLAGMVRHYEDVLGFTVEYTGGSPVEFAILARDGQAIMLRQVGGGRIWPNEAQGGTWDVFFWVRDLPALARELKDAGADFVYEPLVQEAYHMTEFAVRDVEGYVLGFGEPLASPAEPPGTG